jgi:Cep192 domain 4/Galactose oxidase, central domain
MTRPLCDKHFVGLCKNSRTSVRRAAILALLFASLTTFASSVFAQGGTFVPTGSLNTARSSQTATLLNDGRVLIAGGCGSSSTLASAELYDPSSGTFTVTGSMSTARCGHTATLLNDGTVLIAGGSNDSSSVLASAELYSPTTETFTVTGSLNTARSSQTATLLNNGKVLIAGGASDSNGNFALTSAELYDPTTRTFTATGSMNTARSLHTATLLNNGRVIVAGGHIGTLPLTSAELYDPTTGTFATTGSANISRYTHTATLLNNGKVLIAGGFGGETPASNSPPNGILASAELYDPTTGTFTLTASLNVDRFNHTASLLNNGTVLIAGGQGGAGSSELASADLYSPATGMFSLTGSLNTARTAHTASLLNDGTVLIAGGQLVSAFVRLASAELYELVVVSPTSLPFSNQVISTTSGSQTVTLTNNQSTMLDIMGITFSGINASDFAETNNCIGSVAAGASCSINVAFTPAALGSRAGSLNIANNISGNPLTVPLTGTGVTATQIVSLSTNSLTLANQMVGATSPAQDITLTNTGNSTLTISGLAISGTNAPEFVETDNCVRSVAAGATCTINVTFSPTATGARTGTLSVVDNATSPTSPQTVALSGTGQDFSLAPVTPASTTVTAGQTANYTVAVSPAGGFNQTVALTCTGGPALSTCAVTPSSVSLNGTVAANVAVSVTTIAALPPLIISFPRADYRLLHPITELLALSILIGLLSLRRGRSRLAYALVLLVFLSAAVMMSACNSGGGGVGGNHGTSAGTYSLVVSGTFTSGSTKLTHNTNLTLVVQ